MSSTIPASIDSTFVAPAFGTPDMTDVQASYIFRHSTDEANDVTVTVNLFGSDVIDSDVIDAAIEWAKVSQYTPCDDEDSCLFFFDGYTMNVRLETTGDLFPVTPSEFE